MLACALCGVEITDDLIHECQLLTLSQNAGAVFHPWCWDEFESRIVFTPTRESDQRAVVEAHLRGEQ
jgi:hypothetical protein